MNIERRIQKAEERLNIGGPPIVMQIVNFGDGPLPTEERCGNIIIRHVSYENVRERLERAGLP